MAAVDVVVECAAGVGPVANALDAGLTLAEAARLARHASPAVTASVYADVLEANRESLGAKLAQAGFGA